MSHGHSHGPGESHGHSHGPPPAIAPGPAPGGPPQARPAPDPVLQAAIEADFKAVSFALGEHDGRKNSQVLCKEHKQASCLQCGIEWQSLNALAGMFASAPSDAILPPPNVVQPQRGAAVNKTKEEGNNFYKKQQYDKAINLYSAALQIASTRPPWESSTIARDELCLVITNRSAAFYAAGDYLSSLLDAEAAISLKRPWSKGHYRRGRALAALGDWQAAMDAVQLGLQFEPNNTDLETFLKEIQVELAKQAGESTAENGAIAAPIAA